MLVADICNISAFFFLPFFLLRHCNFSLHQLNVQVVASSKNDGFSLSSGDFPTLGSEKDNAGKSIESQGDCAFARICAIVFGLVGLIISLSWAAYV